MNKEASNFVPVEDYLEMYRDLNSKIQNLQEELKRERDCVDEVEKQEVDEEFPVTRISKVAKLARETQKQRKIEL